MAWGKDLGGNPSSSQPQGVTVCQVCVLHWVLVLPLGNLFHQLAADFTPLDDAFADIAPIRCCVS